MANKFKVGDRVRYVGREDMAARRGATAVVTGITERYTYLVWDVDHLSCGQSDGGYDPRDFELIIPTSLPAIRTVTRREIVPGAYYGFWVEPMRDGDGGLSAYVTTDTTYTASDLREAAHLFNQIAEVLEENAALEVKEAA